MADRRIILSATGLGALALIVLLLFQTNAIWGGDSGDLVTAAAVMGVAHPPGYPLYTLLGFLLTRIPLATVSWRVTLLSSIPHALTIAGIFLGTYILTGFADSAKRRSAQWIRITAALFAAATLGGNYLFFLYSTTPEVFALLDLFVISSILLGIVWYKTSLMRIVYLGALLFGLSLTHHHMIVFLLPAFLYLVHKKHVSGREFTRMLPAAFLVFIGLTPYIYVLIAARTSAIINWDNAVDIPNLIRLFTRADYGTFQSGASYGGLVIQRIYQLKMYAEFLFLDLKIPGIILTVAGFVWFWRKNRTIAVYLGLALLFLGPVFFFYASFPVVNRFTLGTYERFLLPSYVLLSILIGAGSLGVTQGIARFIPRSQKKEHVRMIQAGFFLVLWLFPIVTGYITFWRFMGLPRDRTADRFGEDILSSVPEGAMLLLGRDTPLFISQYVRYANLYRADIIVLHGTLLTLPASKEVLRKAYPHVLLPSSTGDEFVKDFIRENSAVYRVFSNVRFPLDTGWYWIQHGLIYQLVQEKDLPTPDELFEENERLWKMYRNPLDGILSRYKHLMLADILDVYSGARIEFGKILLKAGKVNEARAYFESAISYDGDTQVSDAYLYKGLTALFLKDCQEALNSFSKSRVRTLGENTELLMYEAVTYRDCVGDISRADSLWQQYREKKKAQETPLLEW